MPVFKDLIGKQFNRLTVIERVRHEHRLVHWRCQCSCGNETILRSSQLSTPRPTQSCGCWRRDAVRTHGMTYHPTYGSWHAMLQRCTNAKTRRWKHYGGRGISVCESWRKFDNFLADMGERPEHHTLDRIDNDGNYEPGNCRWSTIGDQNSNRRKLIEKRSNVVTAFGKTLTVAEWSRRTGINRATLYWRANQGWPPEDVLRKP